MVYRQLPGQADSPDREPEKVKPVPEHYEGVNFPYRGTEKHGVEVPKDAHYDTREFQYDEDEDEIDYLPEEPEPDPIPVKVVTDTARERLDWRAIRFRVTDVPQQILGRHDRRKAVRIKNHGLLNGEPNTTPVYIGNDPGLRPYTGFEIAPDEVLYPFLSTEDVWAVAPAGKQTELSIMIEFAVEL